MIDSRHDDYFSAKPRRFRSGDIGVGDTDKGFVDPARAAGLAGTHLLVLMETDATEATGVVDDSSHLGVISTSLRAGLVEDPSTAALTGPLV